MSVFYTILGLIFQILNSFAFIVLAAVGLVVIFGVMGIINLAHGEFILVGAYATALAHGVGIPLVAAMGVGVVATVGFGLVLEVTVIKRLYGRLLDSMVATWAIGLITIQSTRIVFGNQLGQIGTPLGSIQYGPFSYSQYRILLAFVSIAVLIGLYVILTRTTYGIKARATMQDPETAQAMGIDTRRIRFLTFGLGSGLAGLTGALYAPTLVLTPEIGSNFLIEAFVAVVVGGSAFVTGTSLSGLLLGFIHGSLSHTFSNFAGQIGLLLTSIIAIRLMPDGISGKIEAWRQKQQEESS